ncbi:MAG: hypothetical protein LWX70_06240, partial [Sphingobacteriia bacterium]|nr:hypothetical protein [Sphingobacteriia bacterium]
MLFIESALFFQPYSNPDVINTVVSTSLNHHVVALAESKPLFPLYPSCSYRLQLMFSSTLALMPLPILSLSSP